MAYGHQYNMKCLFCRNMKFEFVANFHKSRMLGVIQVLYGDHHSPIVTGSAQSAEVTASKDSSNLLKFAMKQLNRSFNYL